MELMNKVYSAESILDVYRDVAETIDNLSENFDDIDFDPSSGTVRVVITFEKNAQ